ncbi:MAG: hypothetical protein M3O33_23810 [Cyanobacteriota bacterium]|nr:hypothetical protein [Cyanobacteriota bacterium]
MPRWTQAARLAQCDRIAEQRPWLNATGPRSTYGKSVSRMNATGSHRRHRNVSPVSLSVAGSDRPLQTGDHVRYIGNFQPTFEACGGELLQVVGLDEAAGAIACRASTGKVIWIYHQNLERVSNAAMD